jgi:mono/diheme cytochrome c family protein
MNQQKSWFQIIFWKLIIAVVVGIALFFGSGAMGFPLVYQLAFAAYAVLGFIVYVVLDAPPMKPLSGWQAGVSILVFYMVLSGGYIIAGNFIPQFEPEKEIDGISRKTDKYFKEIEQQKSESLIGMTRELGEKADQILARLNEIETGGAVPLPEIEIDIGRVDIASVEDPVERGRLVYIDHECGNCHQLGSRPAKKRGPKLDNIGNLMTKEQMKEKIYDPTTSTTEGFEKRKKDKMPDKYPDVMSEDELDWLVTYLLTLTDTSVETPKPIYP